MPNNEIAQGQVTELSVSSTEKINLGKYNKADQYESIDYFTSYRIELTEPVKTNDLTGIKKLQKLAWMAQLLCARNVRKCIERDGFAPVIGSLGDEIVQLGDEPKEIVALIRQEGGQVKEKTEIKKPNKAAQQDPTAGEPSTEVN
jgi:hypothetical protein